MRDERRQTERRQFRERRMPWASFDVSRAEHENLYNQVQEHVRILRRLEAKLDALGAPLGYLPSFDTSVKTSRT
jgi:hypothetical protein